MKRGTFFGLLVFCLSGGLTLPVHGFQQGGFQTPDRQQPVSRPLNITGRINPAMGETSLPMNVMVVLRASGSAFEETRMVEASGRFEFRSVPYANYELFVISEGYQTVVTELYERDSTGGTRFIQLSVGGKILGPADTPAGVGTVSAKRMMVPKKAAQEADKALKEQQKGKLDKAIEHFEKAIEIFPEYADAYSSIGVLKLKMNKQAEAEEAFLKASELDASTDTAFKNLGFIYLTTQREAQAAEYLQKAVALDPQDGNSLAFLGEALYQLERYEESIEPLQKALQVNPENFRASYRLGYSMVQLKRYPEALEAFQQFLKTNKGMPTDKVQGIVSQLEEALK